MCQRSSKQSVPADTRVLKKGMHDALPMSNVQRPGWLWVFSTSLSICTSLSEQRRVYVCSSHHHVIFLEDGERLETIHGEQRRRRQDGAYQVGHQRHVKCPVVPVLVIFCSNGKKAASNCIHQNLTQ